MEEIRIFVIFFNFLSWENVVRLQTDNTKDCELRMVNKWMKHNQLPVMQDSEWYASQEKDQDCPHTTPKSLTANSRPEGGQAITLP